MTAKKKVTMVTPRPLELDLGRCPDVEAVEKDRHLIEAALAADRIIVTYDKALKEALEACPGGPWLLEEIRWIDPCADGRKAIESL